jgi:hypothetical protein
MAIIATYSALQTAIANYLARSDLTSQIQDIFIPFAENRLRRELRTNEMLSYTTLTLTNNVATLPADFLEMRELHFDSSPVNDIEYQPPDMFFRNRMTKTSGTVIYFTILGNEIHFAPLPNVSGDLSILYYTKPDYLSDTNTTNIFMTNYPDCLLYAALAEAETYLMNDARIQTWANLYDRAIQNIYTSNQGKNTPNTSIAVMVR